MVQRVWESLGRSGQAFDLRDAAVGWLAAADRDWVEQIVWALLDNALKYSGQGAIEVGIALIAGKPGIDASPVTLDGAASVTSGRQGGPRLAATIRDHGPGIAAEQRERVFERFARLQAGSGDGTGLGLSVARGLALGTGGDLQVVDPPAGGPGAAFVLALPAERIEEA